MAEFGFLSPGSERCHYGEEGEGLKCPKPCLFVLYLQHCSQNKCSCCAGSCPGENSEDPPHGNSGLENEEAVPEEQPQTELIKQEMLVQYLQDAYSFSMKITEALSLIGKLMYENCVSGV